jgi:hypothetical protein
MPPPFYLWTSAAATGILETLWAPSHVAARAQAYFPGISDLRLETGLPGLPPAGDPLDTCIYPLLKEHFLIFSKLLTIVQAFVFIFFNPITIHAWALQHDNTSLRRFNVIFSYIL